jgi:hypothetical protein
VDLTGTEYRSVMGYVGYVNETSDSVKGRELIDSTIRKNFLHGSRWLSQYLS